MWNNINALELQSVLTASYSVLNNCTVNDTILDTILNGSFTKWWNSNKTLALYNKQENIGDSIIIEIWNRSKPRNNINNIFFNQSNNYWEHVRMLFGSFNNDIVRTLISHQNNNYNKQSIDYVNKVQYNQTSVSLCHSTNQAIKMTAINSTEIYDPDAVIYNNSSIAAIAYWSIKLLDPQWVCMYLKNVMENTNTNDSQMPDTQNMEQKFDIISSEYAKCKSKLNNIMMR